MACQKNLKTELREILSSTVVIRRGGKSQRMSLLSAIVVTQADKALRGNDRAAKAVLEIGAWPGVLDSSRQQHSIDMSKLTDDEMEIFERMLAKSQVPMRDEDEGLAMDS